MVNGKVCEESKDKIIRKSRIKRGIERTLQTKPFEGVVIHHFIDEEIEWSTIEERQKLSNNWTTVMITEFKEIHDRVLEELGFEEKKAYIRNYIQEKKDNLNLDDLDTV